MPKPLSVPVEATSGKRSATDGEPEGQKGRRKHIEQHLGGTKDDVTMGGMSSGQKGSAKGANKSTDAKRHNAVLKTLCVLSQQVREVRGAVCMCWMVKQEAPEHKKPKEQLRAYSELVAMKGKGIRPWSARDSGFQGPVASVVGERQHSGSGQRGWSGKPQANVDDLEPEGFRFGTSLQVGQSVRPSSGRLELVISVAQHREHIRGALEQIGANQLLGRAPSGALERALSAAIEQN